MMSGVYNQILQKANSGKKQMCLLIDPDKYTNDDLARCMNIAASAGVSLVFVGGSLLTDNRVADCIRIIKDHTDAPVLLFPGSPSQVHESADALLFLSLISGRNADLLIGRHVEAAPMLKKSGLEIIPTGYMLIDGGRPTTASYISNSFPIPADKPDIAACTAMAGEMLGLKLIYLDCGSGAMNPLSPAMIETVKSSVNLPVVVGGGVRSKMQMQQAFSAGADIVVTGNAIESDPELLYHFAELINAPA